MTLHDRIENWRRWAIATGSPYGQANSMEGDYRSPQHWHPEGPRGPEVWRADAELLEAAWRTVRPLESRSIILWHHVYRLPEWTIRRRVRAMYHHAIGKEQLDGEVVRAESRFATAIEERERVTRGRLRGGSGMSQKRMEAAGKNRYGFLGTDKPLCPHCGEPLDIAERGAWDLYEEGEHEKTCENCDLSFVIETNVSYSFSTCDQPDEETVDVTGNEA